MSKGLQKNSYYGKLTHKLGIFYDLSFGYKNVLEAEPAHETLHF